MAYSAAISLKDTIERLRCSSDISLLPPTLEILEFAYNVVELLRTALERVDSNGKSISRKRVSALDEQIREATFTLEDVLESHLSNQLLSKCEEIIGDGIQLSVDLLDIKSEILSFAQTAKKLEAEYMKELNNPLLSMEEEEEEETVSLSSSMDCGVKMVGLSNAYESVKSGLLGDWPTTTQMSSLVGMAGIGKTTLASRIFEDPLISSHFECRAWLKVGRKRQLNQIARGILAQVDPNLRDRVGLMKENEEIFDHLKKCLRGRRFLIALDDVWDSQLVSEDAMRTFLPYSQNGSRVLLTTRLHKVARSGFLTCVLEMPLLDNEESWDLLCEKLFAQEPCPSELQKVGKKIAEKCDGLPLTIITVAHLLSKADKTVEYWSSVATERQHSIFKDAYKEMSHVLYPSYDNLSQHLKICFLYMGVFSPDFEIPHLKLISMWISEGFLEPNANKTSEDFGVECLEELVSSTIVMAQQRSSIILVGERMPFSPVKICRIHSALWDLCRSEASNNKFFHVLISRKDGLDARIKGQRRLCIHNNVLFGIKDVYDSIEDSCASTARSLLCTGPHHQFQVPICFGLIRLLRVLDAFTIRFYEFPIQVVKLVLLRYLSLTCNGNGNVSASISKLRNLQFLIVRRHLSIKSCEAPVYLPVEVWDMKELKHLQIMGSHLPDPFGKQLPNLLTLLDASAGSCTKSVLERIPNLKKLGVHIRLVDDAAKPLACMQHISHLNKLETLKVVIANPDLDAMAIAPAVPLPNFPSNLRKLTLSGMGYPWEEISTVASLPCLKVLKLRQYAFRGPKWNVDQDQHGFSKLEFLLIEDSDLVQWKVGTGGFPYIERLCIKHCYQLEDFQLEFCEFLAKIQVFDCNPSVLTCLKQIEEKAMKQYMVIQVHVHSSWDEEKRN